MLIVYASATLFSNAIGLSISVGKNKMHGDFANVPNPNNKELNYLKERVAMMETFMKDADKDGVTDYLDEEKNFTTRRNGSYQRKNVR